MINCGHCRRSHPSVADVRRCATAHWTHRGGRRRQPPQAPRATPAVPRVDEYTSARYAGSSTMARAGRPEQRAGASCSCGVFVTAGTESMHRCPD